MRTKIVGAVCLILLIPAAAWLAGNKIIKGRAAPGPSFIPPAQVTQVKQKIATAPWAAESFRKLQAEADKWLTREIAIPEQGGGWIHDYACPVHGVQLQFDPASPHEHRCPVGGEIHRGEKYDAAWRARMHMRYANAVRTLGVVYALTDDERYAVKGKEILLAYADRYARYQSDRPGEKGKLMWQSLEECLWVIPMAWGYNLLSPEMTEYERTHIANNLLRPAAEVISAQMNKIHNIHAWHNAAVGIIGFALRDAVMVDEALNGKYGFKAQVADGINSDGFWYEGSPHYHYFVLDALISLAEVAKTQGIDLTRDPNLKKMFAAPLLLAAPNGELPAINDGWYGRKLGNPDLYEIAYAWYGDSDFGALLQQLYSGESRNSLRALLHGRTELPPAEKPALASVNFPATGLAVLRAGDAYVTFDYGPHGGDHGHPDKLNFTLFHRDRFLSPDLGTPGYGIPIASEWYRQTISHNTVGVNGASQQPAAGELLAFSDTPAVKLASAHTHQTDNGVTHTRTLALTPSYLLIVDHLTAEETRTFDWVYHNQGTLWTTVSLSPSQPLGTTAGYQHVTGAKSGVTGRQWKAFWELPDRTIRLTMLGQPGTTVITGRGPGHPATDLVPMVIARREAATTIYITVIDWYEKRPVVTDITSDGDRIIITGPDGQDTYHLEPDGRVTFISPKKN